MNDYLDRALDRAMRARGRILAARAAREAETLEPSEPSTPIDLATVATTILRNFSEVQAVAEERRRAAGKTWHWTQGIFAFPEGRCLFCREPMRSQEIYM